MNNFIGPTETQVRFTETIMNIKNIVREARHMPNIGQEMFQEYLNFVKFLDDVDFKAFFKNDDYIMSKMLDAMDYIRDNWDLNYSVNNSIYDVIREFYFND